MSQKLCAKTYKLRPTALRLSLLGALALAAVAVGNTGCEDKGIGRICDVLTPTQNNEAVYNPEALECPSRICVKPIQDQNKAPQDPQTAPLCSASCSQDSDCESSQPARNHNDKKDRHCATGFLCGIAFIKGPLCCQKLCLCKDFLPNTGAPVPVACEGDGVNSCYQPNATTN